MGRLCSVLICDSRVNKSNYNENITLFSIPKDEYIRESWTSIVHHWNGNNQNVSYLCHKHFNDEEIIKTFEGQSSDSHQPWANRSKFVLKRGAIPSIHALNTPKCRKALDLTSINIKSTSLYENGIEPLHPNPINKLRPNNYVCTYL
eukprot:XP_016657751.1 PREDICTED: uncharacterized protein LOC107882990 [Acyrthosiphon pisum]